jgi:tetratricopeptide (TPR) repeat protein
VLAARGELQEAEAALDRAAGTHPDSAVVQLWRGRVKLQRDDAQGALRAFERARSVDSSLIAAVEGMGDAHRRRGNIDAAARKYRDALDLQPDAAVVQRKLVEVLIDAGDFDEAAKVLAGLATGVDSAELSVLRAVVNQGRGDLDGAVDALEAALAQDVSEQALVLTLLANLELQRGNDRRAAAHCEIASSIDDTRPGVFSAWGVALARLGEHATAAEKLERAAELDPDDGYVCYCLGVLYMDYLGDTEKARDALERYIELGGEKGRVEEWLRQLGG